MQCATLLLLVCLFASVGAQAQVVSRVIVYKKSEKAGTTLGLLSSLRNPDHYSAWVDTTNVNCQNLLTPEDFTLLLQTAKRKKHFQQKLKGFDFAGEMIIASQKHFYLYFGPRLLIDLTARINYWFDPVYATSFDEKSKQMPIAK